MLGTNCSETVRKALAEKNEMKVYSIEQACICHIELVAHLFHKFSKSFLVIIW